MTKDKVKEAKTKAKAKKEEVKEEVAASSDPVNIPAGMLPYLVHQRVFDYLPHFVSALKSLHDELVLIRKALED